MSNAITVNWYQVLDVSRYATEKEIKKAYKRLALIHHPDKQGNTTKFAQISRAKDILLDDTLRRELDAMLTYESHANRGFVDADDMINRLTERQQAMQQSFEPSSSGGDINNANKYSERLRNKRRNKSGFSHLKTAILKESLADESAAALTLMVSWPCLSTEKFDVKAVMESTSIAFEMNIIANQAMIVFQSLDDVTTAYKVLSHCALMHDGLIVKQKTL